MMSLQPRRTCLKLAAAEPLEPRLAMTADSLLASVEHDTGFSLESIDWNGQAVLAQQDRWVVHALDAATTRALSAVSIGRMPRGPSVLSPWNSDWSVKPIGNGFFSVDTPGRSRSDVEAWAASRGSRLVAEPDIVIDRSAMPNDPELPRTWGLENVGQTGGKNDADIDAAGAWNITTGSRNVVVAIVDTGIDYRHPDLAANVWTNPGEIPGNGIDDDNNGFVDDVHGYDFVNNDGDPMDGNGHGTHVAGTIGAVGNNGVGVAGVNWNVSMMALKFLSDGGYGSTSGAIAAINYATMMKTRYGVNIVATNNSWGGGGSSYLLRAAIEASGQANITFVAAAGNNAGNNDVTPNYPANYELPNVISVAAVDANDSLAGFSNYGATTVDVAAPGVGIYSTTPNNTYSTFSGTSMATPHVTGLVALLAAAKPGITVAEVRSAVLGTVDIVPGLVGRTVTGGRINAARAVQSVVTVASPPASAPILAPVPSTSTLAAGGSLQSGRSLRSANGQYELSMQADGNLVLYRGATAVWNAGTWGNAGAFATMQADGNFVVYAGSTPLWNSKTFGNTGSVLSVQDDGSIATRSTAGQLLWSSASSSPVQPVATINAGQSLLPGSSLRSANGRYVLSMQTDGNLVLYAGSQVLWQSRTYGHTGAFAAMQDDGNFVVYQNGQPLWHSQTYGNPGARLTLGDDGNLTLIGSTKQSLWATATSQSTTSMVRGSVN